MRCICLGNLSCWFVICYFWLVGSVVVLFLVGVYFGWWNFGLLIMVFLLCCCTILMLLNEMDLEKMVKGSTFLTAQMQKI